MAQSPLDHMLNLPGALPKGDDASDWLDAGGTPAQVEEIAEAEYGRGNVYRDIGVAHPSKQGHAYWRENS